MADDIRKVKIEELPEASVVNGPDIVPVVQGSENNRTTRKTTVDGISDYAAYEKEYEELTTTHKELIYALNEVNANLGSGTLAGLDDVTITSPTNGQTIKYNSSTHKWVNGEGSAKLTNLEDTVISQNPIPGAVLMKDASTQVGGTGEWVDKEVFYTAALTLPAGQSAISYTDNLITAYGSIPQSSSPVIAYTRFKVYTDTAGVVPYNKTISGHTLILKFIPQVADVRVYIVFEVQSATLHTPT